MTGLEYNARKLVVPVMVVILGAAGVPAVEVPVEPDSAASLPAFLTEVATGAPADSLILRVSFYSQPGDGRFDTWAFIVVEELRWPFPPREVRMDSEDRIAAGDAESPGTPAVLAISRIEGGFLNRARRESVAPTPGPGMRPGEIGSHWVRPFEFVEWVSPLRFRVTDGRGRFEISRVGRGRFELVAVEGVR